MLSQELLRDFSIAATSSVFEKPAGKKITYIVPAV